jgi:hypothetical protein
VEIPNPNTTNTTKLGFGIWNYVLSGKEVEFLKAMISYPNSIINGKNIHNPNPDKERAHHSPL